MKKILIVIVVCLLSTLSFFSGCVNVPKELAQFSIISFNVEPGIINQGEFANLSWVVISASSVNIDNGIGVVALTGYRTIQPAQTTTYILTASNATTTRSATVTITVNHESNESHENEEIIISSFEVFPGEINPGESASLTWVVTGATSVSIDNGIGNVPLTGNRIIWPTTITTYTLVASNSNTSKHVSVTIYVLYQQHAPDMGFSRQTTPVKGLVLVRADPGLKWADFTITGANLTRSALGIDVQAGQFIYLEGNTGTITIVHTGTNTLMGNFTWV